MMWSGVGKELKILGRRVEKESDGIAQPRPNINKIVCLLSLSFFI